MKNLARILLLSTIFCVIGGSAVAATTLYRYDALGRVIEVDYSDGSIIYYVYDAAGNRVQTTRHAGS